MNAESFRYFGRKLLRNALVFSFDNFSINYKKRTPSDLNSGMVELSLLLGWESMDSRLT
jgi:hypothetical protein